MEYEVWGRPGPINFAAAGVEEVLQNVAVYLCTPRFSVPLDRAFGIDGSVVDLPMNKARAVISSDIMLNLSRYEPRAKVVSVAFSGDGMEGILSPRVKVRVNLDGFE